jgi:hypothetical protein
MTRARGVHSERAVVRVTAWAQFYTFGLPDGTRNERLDEVRSDLFEQVASGERVRSSDRVLARSISRRAVRGAMADVAWRRAELREQPSRLATRVRRSVLVFAIAAGVATSTLLFVSSGSESSNTSLAQIQVGYLKDQVHGEAMFVVNRSSEVAAEAEWERFDPNYTTALKADQEGVLAEQNSLRALLSQLADEQRQVAGSSAAASEHSTIAGWLSGLSATALVLLLVALWFEPRWRRSR